MKSQVAIVMGSDSDWNTLKSASKMLDQLGIGHDVQIVSAHRTPDLLFKYAAEVESKGIKVIIAGAGGAAHLPGMLASKTCVPVLGVPIETSTLKGLDSLLSINQMPKGIPVGTLAIGETGAVNAALLAAAILGLQDMQIKKALTSFRKQQTKRVLALGSLRKRKKK
ncbi:MAG: 5-(carboxyamino)imidazole ribonucleotide mutase [Proteobacteria bacterium]|nr:5-(carboxyamino)imidazole ribonucleotide mutase [Pseudomonadota bacterium]